MQVLEGKDVDVIEPFPAMALPQAVAWMHCAKTAIFGDTGPQTDEEILEFIRVQRLQPHVRTFGVIDKANLTKAKDTDVPLVGLIVFERLALNNGYFHVTSTRKAWGEKLATPSLTEQAGQLVIPEIFKAVSELQRLSVATLANNYAARNLAQRCGFKREGYFKAMTTFKGKPMDVVHFGLLRPLEVPNVLG